MRELSLVGLYEVMMRAAAAGAIILIIVSFSRRMNSGQLLCVLPFFFGCFSYVLVSSPYLDSTTLGWAHEPLVLLARMNAVFFWWFLQSFFLDKFNWQAKDWVPAVILFWLIMLGYWDASTIVSDANGIAQFTLRSGLFLSAFYLLIKSWPEDLVDARRRFRVIVSLSLSLVGLAVLIAELVVGDQPSALVTSIHAGVICIMAFVFAGWIMIEPELIMTEPSQNQELTKQDRRSAQTKETAEVTALKNLMDDGYYTQESLSIEQMAKELGLPTYRLRKLINGDLGFRNFSAFLNAYRIPAAQALLTAPDKQNSQISQIAFEVGFGSIPSFNRAFKEMTGVSPTRYRELYKGSDGES